MPNNKSAHNITSNNGIQHTREPPQKAIKCRKNLRYKSEEYHPKKARQREGGTLKTINQLSIHRNSIIFYILSFTHAFYQINKIVQRSYVKRKKLQKEREREIGERGRERERADINAKSEEKRHKKQAKNEFKNTFTTRRCWKSRMIEYYTLCI